MHGEGQRRCDIISSLLWYYKMRLANLFKKVVVKGLAPPVQEKTRGMKNACSILVIRALYSLFLVPVSCNMKVSPKICPY